MKRGQSGQRLEFSIEPDVPDRAWDLLSSDDLSGWASAKAELGKPQPEGSLLNHVFNFPSEAAGFIRFQYIPAND